MSILSFLSGVAIGLFATTIFQQVVSGISFVTAAVLFSGAAIVQAIHGTQKTNQPTKNQ